MPEGEFKILFVADVVGHPGRDALKAILPSLKKELHPNLTVVNGENAAGGFGLTAKIVAELKGAGADVITSGNHVFAQKEFVGDLPNLERVLRPANYPPQAPGQGWCVVDAGGQQVLVMNLIGRIFLESLDDPFRAADAILAAHPDLRIVFCDMHAEATADRPPARYSRASRVPNACPELDSTCAPSTTRCRAGGSQPGRPGRSSESCRSSSAAPGLAFFQRLVRARANGQRTLAGNVRSKKSIDRL